MKRWCQEDLECCMVDNFNSEAGYLPLWHLNYANKDHMVDDCKWFAVNFLHQKLASMDNRSESLDIMGKLLSETGSRYEEAIGIGIKALTLGYVEDLYEICEHFDIDELDQTEVKRLYNRMRKKLKK